MVDGIKKSRQRLEGAITIEWLELKKKKAEQEITGRNTSPDSSGETTARQTPLSSGCAVLSCRDLDSEAFIYRQNSTGSWGVGEVRADCRKPNKQTPGLGC